MWVRNPRNPKQLPSLFTMAMLKYPHIPAHVSDSFLQKKIQGWGHLAWSRFDQVGPCKSLRLRFNIPTTPGENHHGEARLISSSNCTWQFEKFSRAKVLACKKICHCFQGLKTSKWICLKIGWPQKKMFISLSSFTSHSSKQSYIGVFHRQINHRKQPEPVEAAVRCPHSSTTPKRRPTH